MLLIFDRSCAAAAQGLMITLSLAHGYALAVKRIEYSADASVHILQLTCSTHAAASFRHSRVSLRAADLVSKADEGQSGAFGLPYSKGAALRELRPCQAIDVCKDTCAAMSAQCYAE